MKRRRILWGRLTLLLLIVAAVLAALYYIIIGIVTAISSLFGQTEPEQLEAETVVVTPLMQHADSVMSLQLDSMMRQPMRLDTSRIAISVYNITTQQQIFSFHDQQRLSPASCMKIATALACIETLGIDHRFSESLQVRGTMKGDTLVGNLLLKADDDPLLESLDPLVKRLKAQGISHLRGNVYLDLAREDTLRPHPTAKTWDIPYYKTPLLLKGRSYIERNLMATLRINGITVKRDATVRPTGRYRYMVWSSHALRDVITPMLIHSSNIKADALFGHLDLKAGKLRNKRLQWNTRHALQEYLEATFRQDSTINMQGFVVNDGSGLSPDNRLTASFLVTLLKHAFNDKAIRDYFINEALATPGEPGRTGSLLSRMSQQQYRGRIFCKTGTMVTVGTSSLAGFCKGHDGQWLIFAIINTDSPVAESRMFQDRLCKQLMK